MCCSSPLGFQGRWKPRRESPETQGAGGITIHVLYFSLNVWFVFQPSSHSVYFCLKLKPLYKELLYTIAHKMGQPSSAEVFTDSQLQQYIKEVSTMASHITHNTSAAVLAYNCLHRFFFSLAPSILSTRLSLWQSQSTTVWPRKYGAQRWEKEVSMFVPVNAPLDTPISFIASILTSHHLPFSLPVAEMMSSACLSQQ